MRAPVQLVAPLPSLEVLLRASRLAPANDWVRSFEHEWLRCEVRYFRRMRRLVPSFRFSTSVDRPEVEVQAEALRLLRELGIDHWRRRFDVGKLFQRVLVWPAPADEPALPETS